MKTKPKIIFDQKSLPFLLDALDMKVNKNGYVIKKTGEFVLDIDYNKFKPHQLIGIYKKQFLTDEIQLLELLQPL